jgi:sterol desaturase/sphingolipid hydroxylase (fatty acid hydroxylase superfamily)
VPAWDATVRTQRFSQPTRLFPALKLFALSTIMAPTLKLTYIVTMVFVGISLVEAFVLQWRHQHRGGARFDWNEMRLSLIDIVGRKLIDLVPFTLAAPMLAFAYRHRIHTVAMHSVPTLLLVFLAQEFCYYWYHRMAHRVRLMWATHAVHHSPNQLTLATAYRLGWTTNFSGMGLFFVPLVWLGVQPHIAMLVLSVNLWYQFWIHNTWTPKLGFLEYIFNTPSAHRVHHASNLEYLDANYGGVLIIFDRLFGTYVGERKALPCRYGLVTPTRTSNPFVVEFEHWATLVRDVVNARNVGIALNHIFRPPGWLPDGNGETTEDMRRRAAGQAKAEARARALKRGAEILRIAAAGHALKHTVAANPGMHQRGGYMPENQQKKRIAKQPVCTAQLTINDDIVRQDRRQLEALPHDDRVAARGLHRPADQRHREHQRVEHVV